MVMSPKSFRQPVTDEKLIPIVDEISSIIDAHLQWYHDLSDFEKQHLDYPFYSYTAVDKEKDALKHYGFIGKNKFERQILGDCGKIENAMLGLNHNQQVFVYEHVVQKYQNAGWHAYFKAVEDSNSSVVVYSDRLIITDGDRQPDFSKGMFKDL